MRNAWAIIGAGLLVSGATYADGSKFEGTWELQYTAVAGERGNVERIVELLLKGDSGTWHMRNASAKWAPCDYRDAPVTVKKATDSDLQIMVERAKVLSGCENVSVKLHLLDDKTLEGSFPRGTKISGQRK